MSSSEPVVRVALIHALSESVAPARAAFTEVWPEAYCFDLLDTSLAVDLAEHGCLDDAMISRFMTLASYALSSNGRGGQAAAILFTCSAFGPAIDKVKSGFSVPVLRPNEAGFEEALDHGPRLGLVVSFEPSLRALESELKAMAAARGESISVKSVFAAGALEALKRGDIETHDGLVAQAARSLGEVDAIVLGQFSLARARETIERSPGPPVITTPHSAADALRRLIKSARNSTGDLSTPAFQGSQA